MCGSISTSAGWPIPDRMYDLPGCFDVRRCSSCSSVFLANPPDDVTAYYPEGYYSFAPREDAGATVQHGRARRRWPALRWAARTALPRRWDVDGDLADARRGAGARILDVGAGSGEALDRYRHQGWDTWGVELDAVGAARAGAKGHRMLVGDFADVRFAAGTRFELVRFRHSLEHLGDPVGALGKAASLMAPGAVLLLELPNVGGWLSRLAGESYWQLDPPRHLVIPDHRILVSTLRALGFKGIRRSTYSVGLGFAISLRMRACRHTYGNGHPSWRLGEPPATPPVALGRAFDPLALVSDAFGAGDSLRVLAVRDAVVAT